jgi:hypothetical protein
MFELRSRGGRRRSSKVEMMHQVPQPGLTAPAVTGRPLSDVSGLSLQEAVPTQCILYVCRASDKHRLEADCFGGDRVGG